MSLRNSSLTLLSVGMAVFVVLAAICNNGAEAQLTFSRDWNGGSGKRTADVGPVKTATAVCHILLNQIRQLSSACGERGNGPREDLEGGPASGLFTGGIRR